LYVYYHLTCPCLANFLNCVDRMVSESQSN
jgi:hypothetical protein